MKHRSLFSLLLIALVGCVTQHSTTPVPVDFSQQVAPVFEHRCVRCHNSEVASGGLNLQDRQSVLASPRKYLVPGAPEESLIYLALSRPAAHPTTMPADGWGISESHLALIEQWIVGGAEWPADVQLEEKELLVELDDYL